jgi:hypothetical protein
MSNRKSQRWLSVLTGLVTLGVPLAACSPSPAAPETPPFLSVPIVDLATVLRFIPFGAELPSTTVLNPAYELVVEGTLLEVRAATAGTITQVLANPQGDFELHAQPPNAPSFLVIYDHVLDLEVGVGQEVEPGDVLGRVGIWTATQGRTELQINQGDIDVCPRDLGTEEFNAAHAAAQAAAAPAEQDPSWTDVCLADTVVP